MQKSALKPLFPASERKPRRKKGSFDRVAEQSGRRLRYSTIGRVLLWYKALRLSPSYELARQFRAGELPEGTTLPADFDTVLSVFDDLGNVQVDVDQWFNDRAFRAFGHGGQRPSIVSLGIVRHGTDGDPIGPVIANLDNFAKTAWIEQGERTTLIAAIPNGLPKAQIMKQIAAILDSIPATERDVSPVAPKYKLQGNGAVPASAKKYISCVERKAAKPDLKLWQIGAAVKLSSTYSHWFDPSTTRTLDEQAGARIALKILTSRALHRGHMIAENAARGIFPSYAKCEHAVPIDWAELGKRLD